MSVVSAINGHAKHVFRGHIEGLLAERKMSIREFTIATYGRDSISNVYPVFSGKTLLTNGNAARWAKTLNVSVDSLFKAYAPLRAVVEETRQGPRPRATVKSTTVPTPALRDHVTPLLAARGLTQETFSKALGLKTSAPTWAILHGKTRLTDKMAARFAEVLGVTPESLLAVTMPSVTPKKKKSGGVTIYPVSDVEESRHEDLVAGKGSSRSGDEALPERFSLTVNADGSAAVRLNLPSVPLDAALKMLASLNLPELIPIETRLRLTHETTKNKIR